MIDSKDISVVVQGAIDKENTPKCLASIRKHLPNAEIILSTWEGSNTEGLDFDILLLNQDPGCFKMSPWEINNVKRQIFSTLQGLRNSSRKYALKIRSDILLTGDNFLQYFNKFDSYNEEWHFFKKRIIIPSFFTRDPRIWESPMCPSDWCSFGLLEDMLALWDIPFPTEEEENWFKYHRKDKNVKEHYYPLIARYNPEQFIWINFIKKYIKNIHTDNMFDINSDSINETLLSYANNLIILSNRQFGIKPLKPRRKGGNSWHIITYKEFLKIYNNYANGKVKIPIFHFQRLFLLKYFSESYKRLYHLACQNNKRLAFFEKELKYFCPYIFFFLKPLFKYLKKLETSDIIIKELAHNDVKISIVIPVHDNFKYFKATLDSLKNQTFKDFEIVVSDDSAKVKNRDKIKKELLNFHNDTGLNVQYIFTKKNLGQSINTNQGLKYIKGTWVRILHADDVLHSSCLSDEIEAINQNDNIIALYHDIIPFKDNDSLDLDKSCNGPYEKLSPQFIIDNALHSHCAIPSSLLFNSSLLNKIDMFNPKLKRACDWDFWARLVLYSLNNNYELIHFFASRIFYRIHAASNTNKISTQLMNYKEYEEVAAVIMKVLKANNYPTYKIFNYLQSAYAYRKKRLINDFQNLNGLYKILLLNRFIKYLIKI